MGTLCEPCWSRKCRTSGSRFAVMRARLMAHATAIEWPMTSAVAFGPRKRAAADASIHHQGGNEPATRVFPWMPSRAASGAAGLDLRAAPVLYWQRGSADASPVHGLLDACLRLWGSSGNIAADEARRAVVSVHLPDNLSPGSTHRHGWPHAVVHDVPRLLPGAGRQLVLIVGRGGLEHPVPHHPLE